MREIDPWVVRLRDASDDEADSILNAWARDFDGQATRIAAKICRTYNLALGNHFDDALSLVWAEFLSVASDVRERGLKVFIPELLVSDRAHRAMMSFLDVEQARGVTGNRKGPVRRRALRRSFDELYAASGVAPSDGEVLAHAQAKAEASLKDPVRQSMVFSREDFSGLGFSSVDAHSDGLFARSAGVDVVGRVDVAWFARRVLLVAATYGADVAAAGRIVWGQGEPVKVSSRVLVERLGLSPSRAGVVRKLVCQQLPAMVLEVSAH